MKKWVLICSLLIFGYAAIAQIKQLPIQHKTSVPNRSASTARLESTTPILLPFWDDFSTSEGELDTAWWMPGSQTQLLTRTGNGVVPPTLNVVTFDGVDASGNPYSAEGTTGPVDSLLSRFIDLSQVPVSLRSSVYLSFFFQVKGFGNQPEPEDSLILYFKKIDGSWQKMWPLADDIIPSDPTIFTEKLLNVPNSDDFFHPEFQFMFQAIGRQNGWFDNWNIDYIYMDKRRSANDDSYLDRALTDFPSSILGQYTAMPFNEFMFAMDPGRNLTSSKTKIRSLEEDVQPVQYTAVINDTLNNTLVQKIADNIELVLFQKDIRDAPSSVPSPAAFDPSVDSLYLEIQYSVSTGDKNLIDSIYNAGADTIFYDHINLRVNDTARTYITINDFFAYDDGSAEYGAGINQEGGRIAYQFITNTPQYIDHVEIYFANISRDQAGSPIELFVLKDLDDVKSEYLGSSIATIQHDDINLFSKYYFSKSIFVQDTFYIGFENRASDGLWTAVGLDKNTDTGNKIYYTIANNWIQNDDIVGSLMIRPYFIDELISSIEDQPNPVNIYPNPSTNFVNILGRFDRISVTDLQGRAMDYTLTKDGDNTLLLFPNRMPTIALIILEVGNTRIVHKQLFTN